MAQRPTTQKEIDDEDAQGGETKKLYCGHKVVGHYGCFPNSCVHGVTAIIVVENVSTSVNEHLSFMCALIA